MSLKGRLCEIVAVAGLNSSYVCQSSGSPEGLGRTRHCPPSQPHEGQAWPRLSGAYLKLWKDCLRPQAGEGLPRELVVGLMSWWGWHVLQQHSCNDVSSCDRITSNVVGKAAHPAACAHRAATAAKRAQGAGVSCLPISAAAVRQTIMFQV